MAKDVRNNQLAQIHIAKNALGLDDETYRAILMTVARVSSSKDLDFAGRMKVLDHFKSRGWKPKPPKKAKQKRPLDQDQQSRKIRSLWLELFDLGVVLDSSEAAINRFIKNQIRVDRIEWLDARQASQIIERLKKWKQRELTKKQVTNG